MARLWFIVVNIFIQIVALTSQNPASNETAHVCLGNWNTTQQSFYHAPARFVRALGGNSAIRQQFLGLFRRNLRLNIPLLPSLIDPEIIKEINEMCPRDAFFYSFAPKHLNATVLLFNEFIKQPTIGALLNVARNELYLQRINQRVWFFALQATLINHPKFNGYYLPWASDVQPDIFLPASILDAATGRRSVRNATNECTADPAGHLANDIASARPQSEIGSRGNLNRCVVYNGTKGSSDAENRLWYFREDMMVNEHHWYWHQYFPFQSTRSIDRRGEMFYFMHHQIIARYNAERLSNGLVIETALDIRQGSNIGHGYNGDLVDKHSGRFWTARSDNMFLNDVMHGSDPNFKLDLTIQTLAEAYDILTFNISSGFLVASGQANTANNLDIRNSEGINTLGDTFEASNFSVNPRLYLEDGIHNFAHVAVALQSDPDYKCRLPPGIMADTSTAMRDPSFYRLHTFVDQLFDHYKATLEPYQLHSGEWPLVWSGVRIHSFNVLSRSNHTNNLKTFWSTKRFPLEEGIDGNIHNGTARPDICHVHLNHETFTFRITIDVNDCVGNSMKKGTVRIFMAPRYDLNGRRFSMNDTRRLMFQLDSFPVQLSRGRNMITRHANDSSSTKPWSRSLTDILRNPSNFGNADYCGCGWPEHLYIPKGTPEGMEFDLFSMVTNFDEDQVENSPDDLIIPEPCKSAHLYCGIPYRKYPDKRPMGYPFDRFPYSVSSEKQGPRPVANLEEYVTHIPNMKSSVIIVQHLDAFMQ